MKRMLGVSIVVSLCMNAWADGFRFHPTTYRVGPYPISIAAGDLNGDGIPEIVTANRGALSDPSDERPAGDEISLLTTSDTKLDYESKPPLKSGFGPYAIAIANIDALKAPDIVAVNFMATKDRDLSLLRNIGEDLFEPHHFGIRDDGLDYVQRRDAVGSPLFTVPGLTALAVADFGVKLALALIALAPFRILSSVRV